jgi:hypothetical protein
MVEQAMWVHGSSALLTYPGGGTSFSGSTSGHAMKQVKDPNPAIGDVAWTDLFGYRVFYGIIFRGQAGNDNLFHFPIPTPVIVNNVRAKLLRVFVLFNSDPGVEVNHIVAFDGPFALPLQMDRPSGLSGQHDGSRGLADLVDGETRFPTVNTPEILWGVDIAVNVNFIVEGNITFTAAGADFLTS